MEHPDKVDLAEQKAHILRFLPLWMGFDMEQGKGADWLETLHQGSSLGQRLQHRGLDSLEAPVG